MSQESLELQIASSQVQHFEDEVDPVVQQHQAAEDCSNCERFLELGINASKWLARAEEAFTVAEAEGLIERTASLDNAIKVLYQRWLDTGERAERWIARVQLNDYSIDNLQDFRVSAARVRDWLERRAWYEESQAAAAQRFAEEPW